MAAPTPCTVYPSVPFVGIALWIDNIKLCSFLLEPDTEVCLPGTVECWRVTLKVVALSTRWSQVGAVVKPGRNLDNARKETIYFCWCAAL